MHRPTTKIPDAMPVLTEGQHVETIGARLKRLRLERAFSQRDLSAPGVSYAYISRIEAGARRPSVKALRMLAAKLGVTPEYLETGSEIDSYEARELRLAGLELRLRLGGDDPARDPRQGLEDAERHADENASVRARIALGFTAGAQGRHGEAIDHLERALESQLVNAVSRPDVFLELAHTYSSAGSPARAVDLLEHALQELK